jgi:hypothetical protein
MRKSSMKKLSLALLFLLLIPSAFAYIDPGTGGYLISVVWAWVVGVLALGSAVLIHFFKFTLKNKIQHLWKKRRAFVLGFSAVVILVILALVVNVLQKPVVGVFDPTISGVQVYDEGKSFGGYNYFEGRLLDMQGNEVKNWSNIFLGVIDTNGDYYAQSCFECETWGRFTWDDEIIWESDIVIHHDIVLSSWDTVFTMTKEVREYNGRDVEFDIIIEVNKTDGSVIKRWSTWDNLTYLQQFHRKLELDRPKNVLLPENHEKNTSIWGGKYDYYHLNSMSIIPPNSQAGRHPAFAPGNWLVSFRHGSMLFILDKDTQEVLWSGIFDQIEDNIEGQHTPTMLPDGRILVFDNGRYREQSRVIMIDPYILDVVWEYTEPDLYSLSQSSVQMLPNNNMLVTEAEEGRVIEITPKKEIVWEYFHPNQQNETNSVVEEDWGKRQQIYRMTRYSKAFMEQFLE